MTPEQNKNFILNNLDQYIIDGKGNFVNLEKDYDDNNYIIWKNEVAGYEEVKEKVSQAIVKDKSKWKLIVNKEIIEDIMESILLDKENWEIVYETYGAWFRGIAHPKEYRYRPTGDTIGVSMCDTFTFDQTYVLLGELGYRGPGNESYDKWGHYRLEEWWQKREYKKNKNQPPINPPSPPPVSPDEKKLKEEADKKFEENKKKTEEERQKQREPFQKKVEEIKIALNNEELPLTDRDLSPQYHDWEEQINHSNDLQKVTNLQAKLLADIQVRREDKKKYLNSIEKFKNIPNFNSKEKIEELIEPVKNNPNFLQQLKANNIPSLTNLIIDKSPSEIIITVKRFEYDQEKEKEKEKKIRAYYHLNSQDSLSDEQINDYLYQEAIGQISSPLESPHNENNQLPLPLILGGGLLILFSLVIIRSRLKRR